MAAIDSLLKLIEARMADGLIIVSGETPSLLKEEELVPLTMPPLAAPLVEGFAAEVLVGDASGLADGATEEGTYMAGHGIEYTFSLAKEAGSWRMEFQSMEVPDVEVLEPEPKTPSCEPQIPGLNAEIKPETGKGVDPSIISLFERALSSNVSDIFLSSGRQPRVRSDGAVETSSGETISQEQILSLAQTAVSAQQMDVFKKKKQLDFSLKLQIGGSDARFRVSLFAHSHGIAASLRPIRSTIPGFDSLGLPGDMAQLCDIPNGLVLVTGAAGSGKSTTLAAMVDRINEKRAKHIITIEDPIEFIHTSKRSLVHQREVGEDVITFQDGLMAALREAPDVILLGEMRGKDVIEAALTAAETGHLVLSTLHTRDAASAVDRIIDVFPGSQQPQVRFQLAASLKAVISQRLLPRKDAPGRVPAVERLMVTSAVSHLIREGKNHQIPSSIQSGKADGMISMDRSLANLVRSKTISQSDAMAVSSDKQGLRNLLTGR